MALLSKYSKRHFQVVNYNEVSDNYDFSRKAGNSDSELLYKLLEPFPTSSFLEIGCGTGNYFKKINNHASFLVGLDISQNMLNKAKSKLSDAMLICSNAEYLPFMNQTFDGVYCIQAFHHIPDKLQLASEIYRLLKKGGRFAIQTCSHEQISTFSFSHYFTHAYQIDLKRFPSLCDIIDLLKKVGFKDISSHLCNIDDAVDDNPSSYLEKRNWQGCSSFQLMKKEEIEEGCIKIKNDLLSGKIYEVIANLKNKKKELGGNATFIKGIKLQ